MTEYVWRFLIVAFALYFWRLCWVSVWLLFELREAGVSDVFELDRFYQRTKKLSREERRASARRLFPWWFRVFFLWMR